MTTVPPAPTIAGSIAPDVGSQAASEVARYARRTLALLQLALRGGGELTDLVAEMHAVIARAPLPFARLQPNAGAAPFPYRIVAGSLRQMAAALAAIPAGHVQPPMADRWLQFVAVLNGVMGDKLASWHNPLATPLQFVDGGGRVLPPQAVLANQATQGKVLLFVPGLCMAECYWQTPAQQAWVRQLGEQGHAVGYLRYNSGLAIYQNGAALSQLLETHYAAGSVAELVFVGHSMGGLLVRSALEHARQQGYAWPANVSHCAFLATPHHGAPLERIGNLANGLLSVTPYTLPFMRLGNIRSRGIKDLRFACLTQAQSELMTDHCHRDPRPSAVPLPTHIRYLLISASLTDDRAGTLLGDGLVPLASARGQHADARFELQAPKLHRQHMHGTGHLALLAAEPLYTALAGWLSEL